MAVVGLDIGTQSLKAIVVDDDLNVRSQASIPYLPQFPRPGWAEQDPRLWLDALKPAIAGALKESGLRASDITALGVAGQLDGCIPTDAEGHALGPCLIWMDRRAETELADLDVKEIGRRTGLVADASHMAAKARWLMRHDETSAGAGLWHQPVSFVVQALCGRAVMDHALASTTMLYNLEQRGYDPFLLDLFGIDPLSLCELAGAETPAGRLTQAGAALTGLPAGTLVAAGTGDDFANAIGAGVIQPGIVSCCLGTAEVVGAVSGKLVRDDAALLQTHGFLGNNYLIGNPGWSAGAALTWFSKTFSVATPAELSASAEEASPGCDGLAFLPALTGAMAPRWVAGARGVFSGITLAHGKPDFARAVLEGCAFAMRDVVDRLEALGVLADRIRLCGGGAKSRAWAEIRADLCQRPVEIAGYLDASPLGAALLAKVAAGHAHSVEELVRAMSKHLVTIEPNPANRDVYADAYERYRKLFDALEPLFLT